MSPVLMLFDPNDLAEYARLHFDGDGKTVTLYDAMGQQLDILTRTQ